MFGKELRLPCDLILYKTTETELHKWSSNEESLIEKNSDNKLDTQTNMMVSERGIKTLGLISFQREINFKL